MKPAFRPSTRFGLLLTLCLGTLTPLAAQIPFTVREYYPGCTATGVTTQHGLRAWEFGANSVGQAAGFGGDHGDPVAGVILDCRIDAEGNLRVHDQARPVVVEGTRKALKTLRVSREDVWAIGDSHAAGNLYRGSLCDTCHDCAWTPVQGIATQIDADPSGEVVHCDASGNVWALDPAKGWIRIFTGSPSEHAQDVAVHKGTYYVATREGALKVATIPLADLPAYKRKKAAWTDGGLGIDPFFRVRQVAVSHAQGIPAVLAVIYQAWGRDFTLIKLAQGNGAQWGLHASTPSEISDLSLFAGTWAEQ